MTTPETYAPHWTEQTEWMRANGVVSAQWSPDGTLIACVLGPKPVTAPMQPPVKLSAEQIRHERRRIALAAGAQLIGPDE